MPLHPFLLPSSVAACLLLALAAAFWPALRWALPPMLLPLLACVIVQARRQRAEQSALQTTLGLLAEFRVPLAPHLRDELPPVARSVAQGYETVCERLLRREQELSERVQRYAFMELHTEDILTQVDAQGRVKYASPAITMHLGWSVQELLGMRLLDLLHPSERPDWVEELKSCARERRSVLLEGQWRHRDGHYIPLEMSLRHVYGLNGAVIETISMARNVRSRNELREHLRRAALTDHLTGLPNRAALGTALDRLRSGSRQRGFALFLFDLDRFKQVNDSLGHAAGDKYLVETACRVRSVLRPSDVLARMGGDEFVALFDAVPDSAGAQSIASRVLEAVSQPFTCDGVLLYPRTSIGIALCGDPDTPNDELISRADRAMYEAKRQGGNLAVVYDGSHGEGLRRVFEVERLVALGLERGWFFVQLQPIVRASDARPVLAEALVRMRGGDGRTLSPAEFIEVAEQTGQILQVGRFVLEQACLHVRRLEESGLPSTISVNVSPRQLMHVDFVRHVERVLEDTGVSPSSIVLEVTESAVMEDLGRATATLTHMRALGFRLALDDFGTGYSSIALLHRLPFDILKIDRSFLRNGQPAGQTSSTLRAIVDIGKAVNLQLIAEGVETREQAQSLAAIGCDMLQGFLFHRPMHPDEHLRLLRERHDHRRLPEGVSADLSADLTSTVEGALP